MFDPKKMLFVILRHGQTALNDEDKFRGWSDDDSAALDKVGIRQAKKAALFLSKMPIKFGIIISSDLDRTIHTAAIVGSVLGINDIYFDRRLRPLNVGDYTGKDKKNADISLYLDNPDVKFPNGESVSDFRKRWKSFSGVLFEWMKEHPNEKPLLVDHLSGIIYWEDINKNPYHQYLENYDTDKEDIVHPGGAVAIMPGNKVIPILGENRKPIESDKGGE